MIVVNVAAFWVIVVGRGDFSSYWRLLTSISIKDGIIALIVPTVAFILDGLLSSDTKARIIYWKWRHPLPASEAFSVHLPSDARTDAKRLVENWGPFPSDPDKQNRRWYQIFTSVEQEIRVREAHRAWLRSRDFSAYAALFLGIFGSATLISETILSVSGWYLAGLIIQSATTVTAARNHGVRFVGTVLTVASQRSCVQQDKGG